MTATTFDTLRSEPAAWRRIPLRPAEGWVAVGLVVLLCLTLAWSVDDASWVVGPRGLTDFLPWLIVLGVGWGFLSAKVGWSRWLAHLLGAMFAALLVPMIVGQRLVKGGGPVDWFQATAAACVDAWFDLTTRNLPFTIQTGHFLLVLGLIMWATGQYAGYVTFHHRRPLNAVILVGIGLVANMSLTVRDQLNYLIVYSLAALFLLIRFHAYDERILWMRHRIGDAAALGGLYLRGGTVFVGSAVVIAMILTTAASSNPLAVVEGRRPAPDRRRARVPADLPGWRPGHPDPGRRLRRYGDDHRRLVDEQRPGDDHPRPGRRPLLLACPTQRARPVHRRRLQERSRRTQSRRRKIDRGGDGRLRELDPHRHDLHPLALRRRSDRRGEVRSVRDEHLLSHVSQRSELQRRLKLTTVDKTDGGPDFWPACRPTRRTTTSRPACSSNTTSTRPTADRQPAQGRGHELPARPPRPVHGLRPDPRRQGHP
jgi:hypothetical protein